MAESLNVDDVFEALFGMSLGKEPDVDAVFRKIVRQPFGGKIPFKHLREMDEFANNADVQTIRWFREHPDRFVLFERDNGRVAVIAARVRGARICLKNLEPAADGGRAGCVADDCSLLHVCRKYVGGYCAEGAKCPHEHHFQSARNLRLLSRLGLEKFDNDELRTIVMQAHPVVCNIYNRQAGHCMFEDSCVRLHVCERLVRGECLGGCNLSHSFTDTEHTRRLVRLYSLESRQQRDIMQNLIIERRKPRNAAGGATASNDSLNQMREVLEVLRRRARDKNSATERRHSSSSETSVKIVVEPVLKTAQPAVKPVILFTTPSLDDVKADLNWQIEIFGTWTGFDDSSSSCIEDIYCDPAQESLQASVFLPEFEDSCTVLVHFNNKDAMTATLTMEPYGEHIVNVRRVAKNSKWLWYWKDDDNSWTPYACENDHVQLEASFQAREKRGYACDQKYRIKYSDWTQRNRTTGKERQVKRRPLNA